MAVSVGDDASGSLVSVGKDGWSVGFSLAGATPTKATASKSQVSFAKAAGGADLSYEVRPDGVKETITLAKAPLAPVSWVFPLVLSGVAVRVEADGSIGFHDATDALVASVPQGVMWEYRSDAEVQQAPATNPLQPVAITLTDTPSGPGLVVTPDLAWLQDPARRYPVTIDPTFIAGRQSGHWDAFTWNAQPNNNFNGNNQIDNNAYVDKVGHTIFGDLQSWLQYDLSSLAGKHVLGATWAGFFYSYDANYAHTFNMHPVNGAWSDASITWNASPPVRSDNILGTVPGQNQWLLLDVGTWVQHWADGSWGSYGVELDTGAAAAYLRMAADEAYTQNCGINYCDSYIEVTYNTPPPISQPATPGSGTILMSPTPTLTATPVADADGDTVRYWFRAATGPDAYTGSVVNSGWQTGTSWTVPQGSLLDGATYYWQVCTWDGLDIRCGSQVANFRLNLRLGDQSVSPNDGVGPATVNLANGNAVVSTSSPSVGTVGGSMGLSYTYNSQAQQVFGLRGYYSNGSESQPAVVRTDPQVAFNWGSGSPSPGVQADNFNAVWSGFVTVPTTGSTWQLGVTGDDNVTVKTGIAGTTVVTTGCCPTSPV
ncbi:MAG: DNRLRE domain-containing protein [Acidimicrobiia bacterium]